MQAIKLYDLENEEIIINLSKVASFDGHEDGTTVVFKNGTTIEVKEHILIVEYLLENYAFEVEMDDDEIGWSLN